MANIGDLILRLIADGSDLAPSVKAQAEKAGDEGAKTLGAKLSAGLKTNGLKAFAGAAASAFAIATKGALDLEDVQVELQRSTGLTADAARDATKALNGIAGRNVTDINAVAGAFEKVHNDLGLTGQAAIDTTEEFVKFGRATKQGPSDAVAAFDDILDAWNLTADQSQGLMDKLVVSQQKWGGSIEDRERDLAQLAPQLRAMNATTDDGIALLNLFAASGLDGSKAMFALNTAVQKIKPGQTFDDLVRQVAAIPDPTKRAQKAIELFGARGGVALANVLRPGIKGLQDFGISATDSAGATDKAADALDSSIRGKIRKAISEASAALRGFGQDFGPALTGIASLGTLVAGLFPGLGPKIASGLAGALKAVAKSGAVRTAASAVGEGIGTVVGAVTGVAARIAQSISTALGGLLEKAGIKLLASQAGTVIGGIFGSAMGTATKLTEQVTGAIGGLAGGKVAVVAEAAGRALGLTMGRAIALAIPIGLLAFQDDIKKGTRDLFNGLFGTDLPDPKVLFPAPGQDQSKAVDDYNRAVSDTSALLDEEERQAEQATAQVEAMTKAQIEGSQTAGNATKNWQAAAAGAYDDIKRRLADNAKAVKAWRQAFRDGLFKGIDDARQARSGLDAEFQQVLDDLKNYRTRTGQEAHIFGQLVNKEFRKGLHDTRPEVRKEVEGVQLDALNALLPLVRKGDKVGKDTMTALRDGMNSKNEEVRRVATQIYQTITGRLPKAADGARSGQSTGQGLANGLNAKAGPISAAARHIRQLIEANLPSKITTTIDVNVRYRYPGSKSGFAAEGGTFAPGGTAIVGEAGQPERVTSLPGGGFRVDPLVRAPSMPSIAAMAPRTLATASSESLTINGGVHLHGVGSDVSPAAARRFSEQFVADASARMFRVQGARRGMSPAVRP